MNPHTSTVTAQPWNSNSQLGSFTSIVLSGPSSTHSTTSVCVCVFPISLIFLLYVTVLCWSHLIECVWNRFSGDKHFFRRSLVSVSHMNRCVRCMTSSNTIIYPSVCVCRHSGKVAATSHRKLRLHPLLSPLLYSLGILCLCVHLSKRLRSEPDNLSGVLFGDKPTSLSLCAPVRVSSVHLRIWVLVIGLCGG